MAGVCGMIMMHIDSKEKEKIVTRIAGKLGERVKKIGYPELNRTLMGIFAGKQATKQVTLPPLYVMPELLVFAGMPEEKLDRFLEEYRQSGAKPVALKAVSTMSNGNWTVYELIEALKAEAGEKN